MTIKGQSILFLSLATETRKKRVLVKYNLQGIIACLSF